MKLSISAILDYLEAFFSPIGKTVLDFFHAAMMQVAKSGGEVLTAAALAAVKAAESEGVSGSEKFDAAKSALIDSLVNQGISFSINAIHIALESAVAKLKEVDNAGTNQS